MQRGLNGLTARAVNDAVRRHLSGTNLQAVMVARDAAALRDELLAGAFTAIEYGSPKEQWVMDEDQEIGALDLGVNASSVVITPVSDVFQR